MSNNLQTILDEIKTDKDTNLKPENLKKGVSLLGVKGNLEPGSGTITTLTIVDPEIPSFTPEYEVSNVTGYDYGFSFVDNKYQSTNQNQDNTESKCKVSINTPYEFNLILHLTQSSENGSDFGKIYSVDGDNLITQFNGKDGAFDYNITIPAGEHYFYISYYKDGSVSNGTDTFTFQLDFSNCTSTPEQTYTVSVTHFASKDDMLADTTCPIDTFAIVYGYGRNLQSEIYRKTNQGWVFTGVSNDPNLIPKNILRSVKIGELYGGYISGYTIDDMGNISLNTSNSMKTVIVNNHTNSFCFLSGYLDALNKIHIQLQYETYAELPMKFQRTETNISQSFTVPNSEGITSTMELIIPANLDIASYYFSATDDLDLNIAFEKTSDLEIELDTEQELYIPEGMDIKASLLYSKEFNLYKYNINVSYSNENVSDINNKYVKIVFRQLENSNMYDTAMAYVNSNSNYNSDMFSVDNIPTKLNITNISLNCNYYSNYETITTELDDKSYTYNINSFCALEYNCDNSEHNLMYTLGNAVYGELSDTLFAKLTYTNLWNDIQYIHILNVNTSEYTTNYFYFKDSDYNITANNFFTNTYSTSVNLNLQKVVSSDVLTSESYPVYNASGMEVEHISNLVVNGNSVSGYTVAGTISFGDGDYTISVYSNNTKTNMISSKTSSDTEINISLPAFATEDYNWNDLYFVILRPLKIIDSVYYDSKNSSVTINDDGSASFNEVYSSSNTGASYQVSAEITDLSSSSHGGSWSEKLTVDDKDTFMKYYLSAKGYVKYSAGSLTEIINLTNSMFSDSNSALAKMTDKNGDIIGYLNNALFLQSPYTSFTISHGNAPDFALLSARFISIEPVAHKENVTLLTDNGELSVDDNGKCYYDDGVVYYSTKQNDEIYDFVANEDHTYTQKVIIAAYSYGEYISTKICWDADGNKFENKYMRETAIDSVDVYAVFQQNGEILHNVIIGDVYDGSIKYVAGTYQAGNVRTTKLQYELNGETKTQEYYVKSENNPLYNNGTVYYTYDGVITSDNNPEEIDK